jgi:serine phosphatase RsbU (regulator of sigma subunit)
MGSDGFTDQNDVNRKRFSEQRLKKLLFENRNLDLNSQEKILLQNLEEHMQNTTQRDDILWIGFRV